MLRGSDLPVAVLDQRIVERKARPLQRAKVAAQTALRHAPRRPSGDGRDRAVPFPDQMVGGEKARQLVVGANRGNTAPGDVVEADHGKCLVQDVGDRAVLLHLRRGEQDPIDTPLHQSRQCVLRAGALRLDARHEHAVTLAARLLLGADDEAAQVVVAEVAGDEADRPRPLHDKAAGLKVRHVAEVAGDLKDAGARGLGDGAAAVQDLAGGLKAHAGAGGYVLDRDMPGRSPERHAAVYYARDSERSPKRFEEGR